ncbi:MAG: penicillin binding protein PBP4B [Firmicutes bacterium]|nr:penicillin binding protein PBP4B [Bacillota bacterium]
MNRSTKIIVAVLILALIVGGIVFASLDRRPDTTVAVSRLDAVPEGTWQAEVTFPDWKGYVDDTLAMNCMYSFDAYADQGRLYLTVAENVESFELFVNNTGVDTSELTGGIFELDISQITVNGVNTVQVSNIQPFELTDAIRVNIPYPAVIQGTPEEAGLSREPFDLISDIIEADVRNGFPSAQLAVIKDGKLVYENAWGRTNAYDRDGSPLENSSPVTVDTLYDLASNTKMYAAAYAVQYLTDQGQLSLDDRIVELIGPEFAEDTLEIRFAAWGEAYPGLDRIKEWKSALTVRDVMMHQAGFPDSGHYHNQKFDAVNQCLSDETDNVLFVENADRENTLKNGICKTPLLYEPGTRTLYSDIDYMLLGLIVERVTGQDLNDFLSETFWQPLGLRHITYNPLDHGFTAADCAATELNGNTRDGLISFPHIRTETVQGEVHDEEAYYTMEGVSGHAGLFANATDLAKLAFVMLSGGYDDLRFFSKDTRDLFIAPQSPDSVNYGIGWWREADDRRVYYFGTQSPESTVGHQGWTGTLTMIDFDNDLVVVYLTNSINTPLTDASGLETANDFSGRWYTVSTLGFVPQIIYMGLTDSGDDPEAALDSLLRDMVREKQKLIDEAEAEQGRPLPEDHPLLKAKQALDEVLENR